MFKNHIHAIKNIGIISLLGIIFLGLIINQTLPNQPIPTTPEQLEILGTIVNVDITPNAVPFKNSSTSSPAILAEAAIVIDQASYSPLYSKNGDISTYPASTTKIASAVVVLEQYNLKQVVTIPADIFAKSDGSRMNLIPGDSLTINDLLIGMLVNSGNDAAYVLAINHPDGYDGFVDAMNDLVTKLHLTNTKFDNPTGYDSVNHYISPRDLAILADYAYKFPLFQQIVNTKDTTLYSAINPKIIYPLHNTNSLLGKFNGINGIKTGWTATAQGVLVTHVSRDQHNIIVVVMRSGQRETDTISLIDWLYVTYTW